jgi:dihydrofolate reductase
MRKLIVSMNLSLDGYLSGPHCELDWHFEKWNDAMGDQLLELLEKADSILLGRITYEAMARYWSEKPLQQDFPRKDLAIAERMESHAKIVFSKTTNRSRWSNTRFISADIKHEIQSLKQKKGKDILLFGSSTLVSTCIRYRLVDEYRLWIHPVILGKGKPLFTTREDRIGMKLKGSILFESGVYLFSYEPEYS